MSFVADIKLEDSDEVLVFTVYKAQIQAVRDWFWEVLQEHCVAK